MKTITFTGHRPNKLKGGYDYTSGENIKLKTQIQTAIAIIMNQHPEEDFCFITGGALGVDQLAFEVVYASKQTSNRIKTLTLAEPMLGMDNTWMDASKALHKHHENLADEVVIVSPGGYAAWKMMKRNEYMVDNSDYVIACWDGTRGGTGNCVKYANLKDKPIIRVNTQDNYEMSTINMKFKEV